MRRMTTTLTSATRFMIMLMMPMLMIPMVVMVMVVMVVMVLIARTTVMLIAPTRPQLKTKQLLTFLLAELAKHN